MLKQQIKERIESYATEVFENNLFFKKSESGELGENQIKFYLNNIFYLFQKTTIYLNLAYLVAKNRGENDLAAFFSEKQGEEAGHDKWAQEDLQKLGEKAVDVDAERLSPNIRRLMDYMSDVIIREPKLYLSYMVFAEYFTVLVTPRLLDNLENKCDIPRTVMSSISKHGELDQDHALEDFLAIDKFVGTHANEDFSDVLSRSIKEVDKFFNEIGALEA